MSSSDKRGSGRRWVYSTEMGRVCPSCAEPLSECRCAERPSVGAGIVRVGRSTRGRKGRGVTTVTGLALEPAALAMLGRELKRKCGSGGTIKDGVIEIQGEHRDPVVDELRARGYAVKRA